MALKKPNEVELLGQKREALLGAIQAEKKMKVESEKKMKVESEKKIEDIIHLPDIKNKKLAPKKTHQSEVLKQKHEALLMGILATKKHR